MIEADDGLPGISRFALRPQQRFPIDLIVSTVIAFGDVFRGHGSPRNGVVTGMHADEKAAALRVPVGLRLGD